VVQRLPAIFLAGIFAGLGAGLAGFMGVFMGDLAMGMFLVVMAL
jgi:hypothetical protein